MEYVKLCPSCGKVNQADEFECVNCEADLTRVRAIVAENPSTHAVQAGVLAVAKDEDGVLKEKIRENPVNMTGQKLGEKVTISSDGKFEEKANQKSEDIVTVSSTEEYEEKPDKKSAVKYEEKPYEKSAEKFAWNSDNKLEAKSEVNLEPGVSAVRVYVRICSECQYENPVSKMHCMHCGEELADVTPTLKEQCPANPNYMLYDLGGNPLLKLSEGEHILGRTAELSDYCGDKPYVSRRQARLLVEAGQAWIENLSHSNPTFVNNHPIHEKMKLQAGDEIGLGGAMFQGKRQEGVAYITIK